MAHRRQFGFTMVELMITIAIFSILVALALPSFQSTIERQRLIGATEGLFADLQYARSQAIKRNTSVQLQFDETDWCYGLDDSGLDCDCANTPANCTINGQQKVVQGSDYLNVTLAGTMTDNDVVFDPRLGMPVNNTDDVGIFTIAINGQSKTITINAVGRIKVD